MTHWQTIDTAPRDGSYIIAARFGEDLELKWVKHSRWITAHEIAEDDDDDPSEYDDAWTDGNDDFEPAYPTHWMPLFAPAKAKAKESA